MKTSIKLGLLSVVSVSAFSMIACGTTAPPSELVDARAAYSRAAAGPAAQLDPADLHTAKESLDAAERQFADESDSQGTKDTSYIALRRSELAESRARVITADKQKAEIAAQAQANQAQALQTTIDESLSCFVSASATSLSFVCAVPMSVHFAVSKSTAPESVMTMPRASCLTLAIFARSAAA